ncbi:copper chaperone PCu(A)C [Campylobacter coli]|nr:copper chaperone PCu(A)C [Campylobacter coli]EHD0283857.1 copper chaperone PCu(A)C [Campylobacter coli]
MKKIITLSALLALSLYAKDIEIKDAFIKQTPPNAVNSAIFLTIVNNTDKDISLIDAKTDINQVSELHTHEHKHGMKAMIQIPEIPVQAHSSTELKPGSYHIMLFKLNQAIDENTKANLTLTFDNNQSLEVRDIGSKKL